MKEANPATEPIAQNLIKLISNLCFSVFVFTVIIFTVIAITYQPPDPWLESAPALTKLFTQSENATFKIDNSVFKTGEDWQSASAPAVPPALAVEPVTEEVIEKSEELITNATLQSAGCEVLQVVNCSDPRVLIAVEKFNLKWFKSIAFFQYQTPVNGSKPDECDVAWRFRNKKEKSWRRYRDLGGLGLVSGRIVALKLSMLTVGIPALMLEGRRLDTMPPKAMENIQKFPNRFVMMR